MKIILLQTTRNVLYLTLVKNERSPVFDVPKCFELPIDMRDGKEYSDIPVFAKFVRECIEDARLDSNKIIFCLEDDNIISKEYHHLPCKKKNLLALARLEAESVLQDNINDYMILNYEYGCPNAITGKLTSSLFAVKNELINQIKKGFLVYELRVLKIVPPISGLLYVGKTAIDSQNKTVAILDFAFEKTHLIIMHNGLAIFQRTFGAVYDDIIELVMNSKYMSFQDASKLVDTYGFYGEDLSESSKQISVLLDTSVNEVIRNIRMVLSCERLELSKLILCGRLSTVPGFTSLFDELELDIPFENVNLCIPPDKLPLISDNAKDSGFSAASFFAVSGLLAANCTDDIDFLNMIKTKSGIQAINIGVLVLVTFFAICAMALEPILYSSTLHQQAHDQKTLVDVKYNGVKELLQEQKVISTELSKSESDSKLLSSRKSCSEKAVKSLFDQFSANVKVINSCNFDNMTNNISLIFQTSNYDNYLTVKHNVESNGYFEIAIPFHAEIESSGICSCSVVLRIKDFVPPNPNSKDGDTK